MAANHYSDRSINELRRFLFRKYRRPTTPITAVSTFCGCGLSDMGYRLAGFDFLAQVEKDEIRAEIGQQNFPESQWIAGTVEDSIGDIARLVRSTSTSVDVLIATPPCQGLSSSNPTRGKRRTGKAWRNAAKNRLLLDTIPLIQKLSPRVVIAENVRQVLTHRARNNGRVKTVPELLRHELSDYEVYTDTVNVADYGIPQIRRRAIIVAVHRDEPWLDSLLEHGLAPWPKATHSEGGTDPGTEPWISVKQWFKSMEYERLSSKTPKLATGTHALHNVPSYEKDRYTLVSSIPKFTGRSAYENDWCPNCDLLGVEAGAAECPACGEALTTRPIVRSRGRARLIKGFKSSYRRMHASRPASTVTTNSSHIGSDNKIHPWEHRVLSALECADLQTVPRFFNWELAFDTNRQYLIRNLIGEAFPPYFTYLHGVALRKLLCGGKIALSSLATDRSKRVRKFA